MDTARLVGLVEGLKAEGIGVWFDADEIGAADSIARKMSEGLSTCDRLLVAWSSHAASSEHVWNEIDAFYMRRPKPGFMLFLRLDDTLVPTLYAARAFIESTDELTNASQAIFDWVKGQQSSFIREQKVELPPAHNLHQFPRGPMVKLHMITDALISAFADAAGTQAKATVVVNNSIRLRLEADPEDTGVTTIQLRELPSLSHTSPFEFWQVALFEACKHGPRMLAALLFSQADDLFEPTPRKDRARLFQHLRGLNHPGYE